MSAVVTLGRFDRARAKQERLCVGVLSGTSADAAEAALCRISGTGPTARLTLLSHAQVPFDAELQSRVLAVCTVAEVSRLDFELGELFAQAVLAAVEKAGLRADQVDVVGSHGQTVAHLPPGTGPHPSTLQIGEAAVIAERCGIPVVSDFRARDVAAGGHGAPLVPYADWVLFRRPGVQRALLNVGGIANVSRVGEALADTVAFDTGPGNMLLDALARRATAGRLHCDLDGQLSSRGEVIPELLEALCTHPALRAPPPRSLGREQFGEHLAQALWDADGHRPFDLLATVLAFTVEATARALEAWVLPSSRALEGLYISGGGAQNPGLMSGFATRLPGLNISPLEVLGFPGAAKEAACFALLASEFLSGTPQSLPQVTGAGHPVVMGKMTP
jgi:anhydro-N-acetylmuramic acid kinase